MMKQNKLLLALAAAFFVLVVAIPLAVYLASRSARSHVETTSERVLHPAYLGEATVDAHEGRVYATRGTSLYLYIQDPPGADYCVQADFFNHTHEPASAGIALRASTTEDSAYLLELNGGSHRWELVARKAGSYSVLSHSQVAIPSPGNFTTGRLCAVGSSLTVDFNSVQEPGLNATDSTIREPGKVGVWFSGGVTPTTGYHLDNLRAYAPEQKGSGK